jgi:hypothetical protein
MTRLTGRRSAGRSAWTLVLCCVVLAAFCGLASVFDEDGDFGVTLCLADATSFSPEELSRALPRGDASRRPPTPSARLCLSAPGLLAAVPGGLCLLD